MEQRKSLKNKNLPKHQSLTLIEKLTYDASTYEKYQKKVENCFTKLLQVKKSLNPMKLTKFRKLLSRKIYQR